MMTSLVFFHWLTLVAFRRFRFILSSIALLILPSSFFAGNISCEDNTKMTSPFRLNTITLKLFRYTLYLSTEDCRKAWNFKYQNLVFSFLTCVIILLFPPIHMVIEHSFMNYSYITKIYYNYKYYHDVNIIRI